MPTFSKQLFLGLLGTLALSTADAQAQSGRPQGLMSRIAHPAAKHPSAARPSQAQRISSTVERPRQTVNYSWNTGTNRWASAEKVVTVYDTNGRPTQETVTDSVTAAAREQRLYTYDAQGKRTSVTHQLWGNISSNAWGNYEREVYAYDAQGKETQYLRQQWNNNAWVNSHQDLMTYDARGNETQYLGQTWNGSTWQTQYGGQTAYTYDAAGILIEEIDKEWDNGVFVFDERVQLTVMNGEWHTVLYQSWRNNAWVNEGQIVDLVWHDWARRLPASYKEQKYNGTAFDDDERYTTTYTSTGGYVDTRQEYVAGVWVNDSRYTEMVDIRSNYVGYDYEEWTNNAWVMEDGDRRFLAYNANNTLVRVVEQRFDDALGRLVNSSRSNYSNFQTIALAAARSKDLAAGATLSPNPAAGWVQLEVPHVRSSAAATGEVRNALGQLVQRFTAQPQQGTVTAKLDLSGLAAGVYTVRLQTGDGALVKRVVRN